MRGMNFNLQKIIGDFDFGRTEEGRFTLTPYGTAVRVGTQTGGEYIMFDVESDQARSADGLVFDMNNAFWKFPVLQKDILRGDLIIHQGVPVYVKSIERGKATVFDVISSTEKRIHFSESTAMPGMRMVTKVISILDNTGNPNGFLGGIFNQGTQGEGLNIQNLMMMNMLGGGKDGGLFGGGGDMQNLMMMNMMSGNEGVGGNISSMLPLLMMDGEGDSDMSELFIMSYFMQNGAVGMFGEDPSRTTKDAPEPKQDENPSSITKDAPEPKQDETPSKAE